MTRAGPLRPTWRRTGIPDRFVMASFRALPGRAMGMLAISSLLIARLMALYSAAARLRAAWFRGSLSMKRRELSPTKTALFASTNWSARFRLVKFEPFSIGLVILTFFTGLETRRLSALRMGIADVCDGRGEYIRPQ